MWSYHAPWFSGSIDDSCRFCPKRAAFLHATAQRDQTNGSHLLKLRKKHILQLRSTQPNFPQLPKQFLTATGPMVPPSFRRSSTAYVASGTSCQPRRRRRCKCSRYGRSINEWQRPTQRRRFGSKILRKELCCLLFFWGGNKFKINKWGSCVLRGSLELWGVEG